MYTLSHPNQIRVGFNRRSDTYSGLLAYIIYMNNGNKYGKEKSFNGWIDGNIPIQDSPNGFSSGFVLNKTVSRNYRSFSRSSSFRIYHPNGYEFEIKPEDFAFICSNCTISAGEIMEPCTLAWDGAELTLIPQSFITQKIVAFDEIDVAGKIYRQKEIIENKIKKNIFLSPNKLKAENIYLHEKGREYFMSGNKNNPSLINQYPILHIDEKGTQRTKFFKRNFNNSPYLIPYSIDGVQDHIVDDNFISKFIQKIDKSLPANINNLNSTLFLPFHEKAHLQEFNGTVEQKSMLLHAATTLSSKFQQYSVENMDFILPLTISIRGQIFFIGMSYSHPLSDFTFSRQENDLLKYNKLASMSSHLRGVTCLSLVFLSANNLSPFCILPSEFNEQNKETIFNQDALFTSSSSIFDTNGFPEFNNMLTEYQPKHTIADDTFVERCFNFLQELVQIHPQVSNLNLKKLIFMNP